VHLIELAPSGSGRRSIDSKKNNRLGAKVLQHMHALSRQTIRPRVWLGGAAAAVHLDAAGVKALDVASCLPRS
jgi:hypothetical protein